MAIHTAQIAKGLAKTSNVYGEILQLYYFSLFFFLECLFRSTDLPTRKRYVKLVESVKENGGEVRFVTSF